MLDLPTYLELLLPLQGGKLTQVVFDLFGIDLWAWGQVEEVVDLCLQ